MVFHSPIVGHTRVDTQLQRYPTAADSPLVIDYLPGRGSRLVVSFAGVGTKRHQCPPPEFYAIASRGGENHVLFISDISRSWLNAPGVFEDICFVTEAFQNSSGATELHAIGNSMGGTMALLLMSQLRFDSVTALVPQVSAHPNIVPEEKRWMHFRGAIMPFRFSRVKSLEPNGARLLVLHGDTPDELIHAQRFPDSPGSTHYIVPGTDHNLAKSLRASGKLSPLILGNMERRPRVLRRTLSNIGAVPMHEFAASL